MAEQVRIVRGKLTRTDLSRVDGFFTPWQPDAWGIERPVLLPALARLSAELSSNIYELDVGRWLAAGWSDCTLQMENRIMGGVSGKAAAGLHPGHILRTQLTLRRARALINPLRNPVGDLFRAARQMVTTDTGKALVMAHAAGEGRYVVAICFMGTSHKFYDWLTNFKLHTEDGMHAGFLELARQFDSHAERILFPETGSALDIPALSLDDVLDEARRPDSRFRLWITGHSQGAAVSQTYMDVLLRERGVLAQNTVAYTLAAPTVASGAWAGVPAAYPIYNIINADDLVPCVGASVRLGMDLIYSPDDAFRVPCYGYDVADERQVYARERVRRIMAGMCDTPSTLEMSMALFLALHSMRDREIALHILTKLNAAFKYVTPAATRLGIPLEDISKLLADQLAGAYRAAAGHPPDEERVRGLTTTIVRCIEELGPEAFSRHLVELTGPPHGIVGNRDGSPNATYCIIACKYLGQAERAIWQLQDFPRLVNEVGEQLLPRCEPTLLEAEAAPPAALPDSAPQAE